MMYSDLPQPMGRMPPVDNTPSWNDDRTSMMQQMQPPLAFLSNSSSSPAPSSHQSTTQPTPPPAPVKTVASLMRTCMTADDFKQSLIDYLLGVKNNSAPISILGSLEITKDAKIFCAFSGSLSKWMSQFPDTFVVGKSNVSLHPRYVSGGGGGGKKQQQSKQQQQQIQLIANGRVAKAAPPPPQKQQQQQQQQQQQPLRPASSMSQASIASQSMISQRSATPPVGNPNLNPNAVPFAMGPGSLASQSDTHPQHLQQGPPPGWKPPPPQLDPSTVNVNDVHLFSDLLEPRFKDLTHGLLGMTVDSLPVLMHSAAPFCMINLGIQGSGKSHTSAVAIENCAASPHSSAATAAALNVVEPCACLVLHYDTEEHQVCRVTTLVNGLQRKVVLVNPSNFIKSAELYRAGGAVEGVDGGGYMVKPLLFEWSKLSVKMLSKLLRISDSTDTMPVYQSVVLIKLRKYQKTGSLPPSFKEFKEELIQGMAHFDMEQFQRLAMRMTLLESFLLESDENESLRAEFVEFEKLVTPGTMIVADLSDPLISSAEVCGIFEVVIESFKSAKVDNNSPPPPKLLMLDEAHKFFDADGVLSASTLAPCIAELVRQMRHINMRVILSSQSPMTIPDEILELSSMIVMHQFFSSSWFKTVKANVPLEWEAFEEIMRLKAGTAMVFCPKMIEGDLRPPLIKIRVRQ